MRLTHPLTWLLAALTADLASYSAASDLSAPGFWIALDLFLTYRIYRGGATALAWFRFLLALGTLLPGIFLVLSHLSSSFETGGTPLTVALLLVSLWCLAAPALTRHVQSSPSDQPAPMVTAP